MKSTEFIIESNWMFEPNLKNFTSDMRRNQVEEGQDVLRKIQIQ